MLTPTRKALDAFDNSHDFERMSADILNHFGLKDVILIAPQGGSDGGRDIEYTTSDGQKGLAFVSLRKDAAAKFNEDLSKRKSGEYDEYRYFTNRSLTAAQKDSFRKQCNNLNAQFMPHDVEAIRSMLDAGLQEIRELHLHIKQNVAPNYSLELIELKKYSASELVKYSKELLTSEQANAGYERQTLYSSLIQQYPFAKSSEVYIADLEKYVKDIDMLSRNVSRALSFNVCIQCSKHDTNIEVEISPPKGYSFGFEDDLIQQPEQPSQNYNGLPPSLSKTYIQPVYNRNNNTEFYTMISEEGILKSSISEMNAQQRKMLFDERVYIKSDNTSLTLIEIEIRIYSNKLVGGPIVRHIVLDPKKAATSSINVDLD